MESSKKLEVCAKFTKRKEIRMLNLTRVKSKAKLKGYSLVDLSLMLGRQRSYLYDIQNKGLKIPQQTLEEDLKGITNKL